MNIKKILSNEIIINVFWLLIEKILTIGLIFYAEGLIAKILTKHEYGQWVYSLNLVTLISSIALIAGAEVAVPSLSRNIKLKDQIIVSIFKIRMLFAIIAFVLLNLYSLFFIEPLLLKNFTTVLSLIILFNEPFSIIINYYQSIIKIKIITVYRLLSLIFRAAIIAICFYLSLNIEIIAWARVCEMAVLALILTYLWKSNGFVWIVNKRITYTLFLRGVSFWPSLMLMYLYLRMDRFFVEHYLSFETLAIYGIAVQLTEQTFVLIKMIIQSAAPKYIFKKMTASQLKKNIFNFIVVLLGICFVIWVLSYIFLPILVNEIFGYKYVQAANIAIEMLPALIFFSIDSILMQYLYKEKKGKLILIKWISGVLLMIISYTLYFNYFGSRNLALIYNVNYFIMMILTIIVCFQEFKNAKR